MCKRRGCTRHILLLLRAPPAASHASRLRSKLMRRECRGLGRGDGALCKSAWVRGVRAAVVGQFFLIRRRSVCQRRVGLIIKYKTSDHRDYITVFILILNNIIIVIIILFIRCRVQLSPHSVLYRYRCIQKNKILYKLERPNRMSPPSSIVYLSLR